MVDFVFNYDPKFRCVFTDGCRYHIRNRLLLCLLPPSSRPPLPESSRTIMTSTRPNSAKRKRPIYAETEDESETSITIARSKLWLDDGNVILQAGNTQFKVHKSILSLNSTVFSDMFLAPQPSGEPLIEQCPIVHLSDTAADVTIMLEAFCQRK